MSIPRLVLTLVLAVLLLGVHLPGAAAQPQPDTPEQAWQITCVDCPKWFGDLTDRSLRLDTHGRAHMAYGGDRLYYAVEEGGQWRKETVDGAPQVGAAASLALGPAGRPMISYFDGLNRNLKFAVRGASGWRTQTVDMGGPNGAVGAVTALDVDRRGRPHIAYLDSVNVTVKYARRDVSGWQIEQIDRVIRPATAISLVVDSTDSPHVCYFRHQPGTPLADLIYASRSATGWVQETVAADVAYSLRECSLALDANDEPVLTYPTGDGQSDVVRRIGAGWHSQTITWEGDFPIGFSLAVDADGFPHISATVVMGYEPQVWGVEVQYEEETGWRSISRFGASPGQTSLALDASGHPLMGHMADPYLLLSAYDGAIWSSQGVDERWDVGRLSSLAVGVTGQPAIAYWPGKIAAWADGAWAFDTFFRAYGEPTGISLAIGNDGQPAVAYSWYWSLEIFEETGLDYVVRGPAGWTWETLYRDDGSARAGPPALALDAAGTPQVSNAFSVVETWPPGGPPYVVRHFQRAPSGWAGDTVDEFYDAPPQPVAMRLDAQGEPVIAYTTPDASAIKLARRTEGGWLVEVVDPAGGRDVALALDAAGSPRLSYASLTGQLKYASRAGSGWQTETVAAGAFAQTSVALDAAGYAHISAYDAAHTDLVYARQSTAGWRAEVIASRGDVGRGSSLALADAGQVLISFYDASNRDLMLAVRWAGPPLPGAFYLPLIMRP